MGVPALGLTEPRQARVAASGDEHEGDAGDVGLPADGERVLDERADVARRRVGRAGRAVSPRTGRRCRHQIGDDGAFAGSRPVRHADEDGAAAGAVGLLGVPDAGGPQELAPVEAEATAPFLITGRRRGRGS